MTENKNLRVCQMPYRRSTRATTRKPRKYYKKRTTKGSFDAAVKRVLAKQAETKFNIVSRTESAVYGGTLTSPANFTYLNSLNEGFTENQRVGNKVRPMMVNIRGSIQSNSLKPIITKVYLLETNVSNDPRLDLLEDNGGNFSPASTDLAAIYARINTAKYKILKTMTIKTGTYANHVGDFGGTQLFNETIKLNGVYEYEDGETACNKRALILLPIFREAQNDTSSDEVVEFTFNSKLYYKDI